MTYVAAIYQLCDEGAADTVVSSLESLLSPRRRSIPRYRTTLLDTPDGRLQCAGLRLESTVEMGGRRLVLTRAGNGIRLSARIDRPVTFSWDLPLGPLRTELERYLDVRCLLPVVELERRGTLLEMLDKQDKTVARIRIEEARTRPGRRRARWHPLTTTLTAEPVRGYESELGHLLPLLDSRPGLRVTDDDLMRQARRTADARAVVRTRPKIRLERSVLAADGARAIHRAFLEIALDNEDGMRLDLDSEFLHDYRVSIRRTRAALVQLKEVFDAGSVEFFKEEFRWLGSVTGKVRDLDVFLLRLRLDDLGLSAEQREALSDHLVEEQRQEHARLVEQLDSPRYRRLLRRWRRFLDAPAPSQGSARRADQPLVELVSRRMRKLYRRMVAQGTSVSGETPTEVVHGVRLDGKKLRYLLDATRSLFEPDDVDRLVSSLKKLQNVLGAFNDAEVQQVMLAEIGQSMAARQGADVSLLLALGGLIEKTREQGEKERRRFRRSMDRFAAGPTRRLFRRVCSPGPRADASS